MPIPFLDADEIDDLGSAAYVKIECPDDDSVWRGAIFVINSRGEPLEFIYNYVNLPESPLWRSADLRRQAEYQLLRSMLPLCQVSPKLLICRASEIGPALFQDDIRLQIPVARLDAPPPTGSAEGADGEETDAAPSSVQVHWTPPLSSAPAMKLLDHLTQHGLLLEPFERAAAGLGEVLESQSDTAAAR